MDNPSRPFQNENKSLEAQVSLGNKLPEALYGFQIFLLII